MDMSSVDLSRVPSFYHKYISLVTESDLSKAFINHQKQLITELEEIPEEIWDYRYAEGKWSIRELVQHVIDAERIFCYRALRFARKDKTELPGFDEELFAASAEADRRSKADLLEELGTVQRSSAALFRSFSEEQLNQTGTANGSSIYVSAIGHIIVGHPRHHLNVLKERYLQKKPSA
jgi:uncharacterized damage-inducible protein DinB